MLDISFYHDEIKNLSKKYIENRVIPVNKVEDALHIAISTVYEIDILLSWNYRHLANLYKERKIVSINISEGYSKELKLTTPMEVIYEEE